MSRVTFRCDQCGKTTDTEDPFQVLPSGRGEHFVAPHWVRAGKSDFCSSGCATKHHVEPIRDQVVAAKRCLDNAVSQLHHNPEATSGDMFDVHLTSAAAGHITSAMRLLREALKLCSKDNE